LNGRPEDELAVAKVLLDVLDKVEETTLEEAAVEKTEEVATGDADVTRLLACETLAIFATLVAVEALEDTDDVLNTAPQMAVLDTPGIRVPLR